MNKKLNELLLRTIELLEYDAAAYDLSAKLSRRVASTKNFRARAWDRRRMVLRLLKEML